MRLSLLGLVLSQAVLALPALAQEKWNFELRDPRTKEVYYTGEEIINKKGATIEKETRFFDTTKKTVSSESFAYDGDSLKVTNYSSVNSLSGEEAKIVSIPEGYDVHYRAGKGADEKKGRVTSRPSITVAALSGDMIKKNWAALLAGKPVKFDLLLPSRMETIPFQLVHRETRTVDNEAREVFSLIPQNYLIRLLAPHLEFQFTKDGKIRQASFPSPLPINGAKDKMVEMILL